MNDFRKVVRLGTAKTHGGRGYSVFCKIEFTSGRLSITGVEGPTKSGNALGSCGQIAIDSFAIEPAPGWDRAMIARFRKTWSRWHLNDMVAGTPAQMAHLRTLTPPVGASYYDWALERLAAAGLQPDNGYSYGSRWLREEVPADVLDELRALPDTDRQPAWV